jgi:hypothetical protein
MKRSLYSLLCIASLSYVLQAAEQPPVFDFNQSTKIIMGLLQTGKLSDIVEENASPEGIERLIKNFSPAQMALEIEVLNCTMPVLLYFFTEKDAHKKTTDILVTRYAQQHSDQLKVVTIDAAEFFSIAQHLEIEKTPYFMFCNKREITEQTNSTDFLVS